MASNLRLRERMGRLFGRVQLVEMMRQRDGAPLLEIWRAEDPVPKLKRRPSRPHRRRGEPAPRDRDPEIDPDPDTDSAPEAVRG
ncbi:MAG TPA: hypothetical protein VMR21_15800 [Vicinamibacteria bacterium]|nr:hypothetical protein [Vicinamibacteria bacterium]